MFASASARPPVNRGRDDGEGSAASVMLAGRTSNCGDHATLRLPGICSPDFSASRNGFCVVLVAAVPLEVRQRATHDRVGDRAAQRSWDEAPGINAQVELDARAIALERLESPFASKVAEVSAAVLAGDPVRFV